MRQATRSYNDTVAAAAAAAFVWRYYGHMPRRVSFVYYCHILQQKNESPRPENVARATHSHWIENSMGKPPEASPYQYIYYYSLYTLNSGTSFGDMFTVAGILTVDREMGQNGLIMVDILFKNPGMKWKKYYIRHFYYFKEWGGMKGRCNELLLLLIRIDGKILFRVTRNF